MAFELPALPYAHDALGPYMSQETLEFHHDKHHQTYVTNLNNLIKGTDMESASLEDIVKKTYNVADKAGVFNNASQHWNHVLFWECMKKNGGGNMPGELESRIIADFGSVADFKAAFVAKGAGQFGSGWAWLVSEGGKLSLTSTTNAGNPMTDGKTPILTLDVWEHAYYVDYRNARPKFIAAYLEHLVNWDFAAANFK